MPTGHSARPSSGGKRSASARFGSPSRDGSFSSSPVTRSGSGFRYSGPSHSVRPAGANSASRPFKSASATSPRVGGFKGPARTGGFKGSSSRTGVRSPGGFGAGRRSASFARKSAGGFGGGNRFAQKIDFSKFVKKAEPKVEQVKYVAKHTFADFPFNEQLQKNIAKKGFVHPTPIQDQSIMTVLEGRDFFGLANTGTGKTGAFILPLIDRVSRDKKQQVLIMAPTRELAQQIEMEFRSLSLWMSQYSASVVGGMPINRQISEIKRGVNFVIGTPGRITDLVKQKVLDLSKYSTVVLDEADRMLDMGFRDDMTFILGKCSPDRQTLFFSATLSPEIKKMTEMYLKNPLFVSVVTGNTSKNIDQDVVRVKKEEKLDRLHDILIKDGSDKVLIFRETKRSVDQLETELKARGFKVAGIHGDKRNRERMRTLDAFKMNQINILIATDVAARGLDIPNVTHVINYDIPNDYETYVHRIGRTGRADKTGTALTFIPA